MRLEAYATARFGYRVLAALLLTLVAGWAVLDYASPPGKSVVKVTGDDAVNYFGIAHSLLFDRDFDLTNEFVRTPPTDHIWTPIQKATGLPGSPWPIGYSLFEIPFLAAGTGVDALAGNPRDGYSRGAVFTYSIGNAVFTGLGLIALFTLLLRLGPIFGMTESRAAAYGLAVAFFILIGTNVGYYAYAQYSHATTFLMASIFLVWWWKVRDSVEWRGWLVLGLLGGVLSICRWQEVLYFAGPLVFDLLNRTYHKKMAAWLQSRMLFGAAVAVCWIPQIIEWKTLYGKYLLIPQGPGMITLPPSHIWSALFSSHNGWFSWTPMVVLGLAGLIYGAARNARLFVPWLVVIALEVATVGSLSSWHGHEAFGSRFTVALAPLIGMGLFTLLANARPGWRAALAAAAIACCIFTTLFVIQYRLDLFPRAETLTFSEYFTDKFRLQYARHRKAAVNRAWALIKAGRGGEALPELEPLASREDDRSVLAALYRAYQAAGRPEQAAAKERLDRILRSRLD